MTIQDDDIPNRQIPVIVHVDVQQIAPHIFQKFAYQVKAELVLNKICLLISHVANQNVYNVEKPKILYKENKKLKYQKKKKRCAQVVFWTYFHYLFIPFMFY